MIGGLGSQVERTVGAFLRDGSGGAHDLGVEIVQVVLFFVDFQDQLVKGLHVLALFLALLFEGRKNVSGFWVVCLNLFDLDEGNFDHVEPGSLFEVLFPLSFIEGLSLDDILSVVSLVLVDLLDHFRVKLLRFPEPPTHRVVRVLCAELQDGFVVIVSIRP